MRNPRVTSFKFLALALTAGALPLALSRCRLPEDMSPPPPDAIEQVEEGYSEAQALRLVAKDRIARDAADGRVSLLEAAALFRELNKLPPAPARPTRVDSSLNIPADTEEAWLCRQVAAHVRVALRSDPARAEAAVARLEDEFFAELRAHGALRLPDAATLEPVHGLLERARARLAEQQRGGRGPRPVSQGIDHRVYQYLGCRNDDQVTGLP
jgi:hypothetical protein